jgi:GDSL-like Lipase/Acylhydrolase family
MTDEVTAEKKAGVVSRVARWAAIVWIQIGITIVLFGLLSVMAGLIVKVVRHSRQGRQPAETQAYPQAPWAPAYFKAMNSVHMRWYPYVYWKTAPMRSPYLNIDQQSNRVNWNKPRPPGGDGRPVLRVFAFGGSTTWGAGARDDFTIPSLLAKQFASNPRYNVEVSNFGQMGWVTSQELLYLYRLLARGERPDLVIFYDGVNDCFLGYQNGIAGLTQNEFLRADEFGLLGSSTGRKRLYWTAIRTALMSTGLADLIKLLSGKGEGNVERREIKPVSTLAYLASPRDFEGNAAVEQDIVDVYLFNKQIVETLGRRFGFRSLFYWQPVIYSKRPLTAFERHFLGADSRQEFFSGTYKRVAAVAHSDGVHDISGILDRDQTYFIDPWHITEAGNEIVAQRMAADAAPILAQIARERQTASRPRDAAPSGGNRAGLSPSP